MPSLEGKAWAGANGYWVVYIGYNYEWELVNVYTHHRVPLSKITDCPKVEHTDDLHTFKYDHADCRLQKIAICWVPNRTWNYKNYEVVAIFDKLVAVVIIPRFVHGYCSKISFYTRMMSTTMQLNTRILCLLPPLVALFLHGILVVSVRLSSTVIIIVSSTCMRVSKFPLTN